MQLSLPDSVTNSTLKLTRHAYQRCQERRITSEAVDAVWTYGRELYKAGSRYFYLGEREIAQGVQQGTELSAFKNIVLVTLPGSSRLITTFRCSTPRQLRPGKRKRSLRRFTRGRW